MTRWTNEIEIFFSVSERSKARRVENKRATSAEWLKTEMNAEQRNLNTRISVVSSWKRKKKQFLFCFLLSFFWLVFLFMAENKLTSMGQ